MSFKVKKDLWIQITLYVIFALIALSPLPWMDEIEQHDQFAIYAVMGVSAVMILPILLASVYVLKDDHLHIRLGYIIKNIKYDDIIEIKDVKKIANNSFALSSDAVEIVCAKGMIRNVAVSPVDKQKFIDLLKYHCKYLNKNNNKEDFDY